MSELGKIVLPAESASLLVDEPDDPIPECALAAGTGVIATGDRARTATGRFQGARILSPGEYRES